MHFKYLKIKMLLSALFAFFLQIGLFAQAIPLGIVLRDSLFKKIIDELNRFDSANKPMELPFCINDMGSSLKIEGKWLNPNWTQANEKIIYLSASARNVKLTIKTFNSCKENAQQTAEGSISIVQGKFTAHWNISDLSLAELSLTASDENVKLEIKNISALQNLIETTYSTTASQILLSVAKQQLSKWISERLRNLFFAQSASEIMSDLPILKSGILLERGAIKLELADPKPAQEHITFSFYPRKTESAFASAGALEFYFNTAFFDINRLKELTGLDPLTQNSTNIIKGIRASVAKMGPDQDPPFSRPSLENTSSDISLVLPESLINSALSLFYREGLLRFRTTIDLGVQTKGIIAKEEQKIKTVLTIKPDIAPSVNFLPEQLRLEVNNYVMDVGTYMEDRIIPTNQISSHVSLSAHLEVDTAKEKIKLLLNPEDLLLDLKSPADLGNKNNGNPSDMDFFKSVANTVWRDFLKKNEDLYLFPLVFNPRGMKLAVTQTRLDGKNIILDLNMSLENEKK